MTIRLTPFSGANGISQCDNSVEVMRYGQSRTASECGVSFVNLVTTAVSRRHACRNSWVQRASSCHATKRSYDQSRCGWWTASKNRSDYCERIYACRAAVLVGRVQLKRFMA